MHFIDKAREYQKYLDTKNITAYEYSRVLGKYPAFIGNFTRLMQFSYNVQEAIKKYKLNSFEAPKLLRLLKYKDDDRLIKMIRFIKHKNLRGYDIDKLIDYEMMKDRR